jgi:RNA polymerase sigma-70 factor (sigma-E family)
VDRDAEEDFRAFVNGAYRRLMRTGYLLTGDQHRAEDLVQVTLAKAAQAWHRIGQAGAVDAYVRRIMVNSSTSLWRRRRWREQLTGEPPERPARDPYAGIDERGRLRRALAALPARQRAAVVLRHYEDLSEVEAAAALGCTVGTVKSLSSRGLARLRTELTAEPPAPRAATRAGATVRPPTRPTGAAAEPTPTRAPAVAHRGEGPANA